MRPHVLVVEDEPDLRSIVEYNLRLAGFDTEGVGSGWAALQAVSRRRPDLVILGLMLPDLPGTQVCRELREGESTRAVPVLMLTAKGEERDRVTGLEIGADDYLVKPASMRELVLRANALLRRRGAAPGDAPVAGAREARPGAPVPVRAGAAADPEVLESGALRVDLAAHRVTVGGTAVELTPLEFRLLETLVRRAGRVQSRETLLEDVWQVQGDPTSRTVDTHVKRLRSKLGAAAERIETVRGLGYRLRAEA